MRVLSLWISVVSELRAVAAASWRALAEVAVRPSSCWRSAAVSGQLLDGGLILLAFLFGSAELLAKINLRLRHRFNSLMHLTEALIVGFLALTENAHYAVKPLLALITALGGQFNHFGLDRLGDHRRFHLLVVEGHHRGALLCRKLQALSTRLAGVSVIAGPIM